MGRSACLSQLLPYQAIAKKNGDLQTGLKEYQALLRAFLEANRALQKGDLEKFDSLVGENACQIRTFWMAKLATKGLVDTNALNSQIVNALEKIDQLLESKTIVSLMNNEETLQSLLDKEQVDIPLTQEEIFVLQSYLLTEMKNKKYTKEDTDAIYRLEVADFKQFQRFGDVSISFSRKLLSKFRNSLATSSVQFVRDIASSIQDPSLMKMVSKEFEYTAPRNSLPCIPMFWSCKAVFRAAQNEGIPLILHAKFVEGGKVVEEEHLFFTVSPDGSYVETAPSERDLDRPACVVQGIVTPNEKGERLTKEQWKALMKRVSPVDAILAGAADHRQYPDATMDIVFEELKDSEYDHYRALAIEEGFSSVNTTGFFIQHVYAERTGNILQAAPCIAEQSFLSRLLPYDPAVKTGDRLQDGLCEYMLLLIAAELAMEALQQGKLKNFDPLVGENACQIRAVRLALMITSCTLDSGRLLNDIARAKTKIEEYFSDISNLVKSQISLQDLLKNDQLDVEVDEDELFLIKSYLLSKVKVLKPLKPDMPLVKNEITDTKKLKEIAKVGSMFADNLVKSLRERMAAHSVDFVQALAQELPSGDTAVAMVAEEYSIHHRGLKSLPCYWTAEILMQQAMNKQIPIVVIAEQRAKDLNYDVVKRTAIYFQATTDGYQEIAPDALDSDKPALYLLGTTCRDFKDLPETETWERELVEYCPAEMLLAYAATHRQYPDASKEDILHGNGDDKYEHYKTKAHEWGCSAENPSRFFLAHAFCDKVGNVAEHLV